MKNLFLLIFISINMTLQSSSAPESLPIYLSPIEQDAELECSICQEEIGATSDRKLFGKTRCNHIFHISCINTWLEHNDTCPICRGLVKAGVQSLLQACIDGNINHVRISIAQNININFQDTTNSNYTPLMHACENQHEEIALLLINTGALINLTNTNQYTALHITCENGNAKIANMLLTNGADPLLSDLENTSPLMIACMNNYLEIVNLLLANNDTNINQKDTGEFGLTALHYACQYNFIELIEPLLDHGANIDIENNEGIDSYQISELLDDHEIKLIFDAHIEALEENQDNSSIEEEEEDDEDDDDEDLQHFSKKARK